VAVVGLGQAGGFAVHALRRLPRARIVCGVDPLGPAARTRLPRGTPVHTSVAELAEADVEVAVVATPTPSHVDVCHALLDGRGGWRQILCEKPLSTDASAVRGLMALARRMSVRLRVLYHYVFGPEVLAASSAWPHIVRTHGRAVAFESTFLDPKPDVETARRILVSAWADSGINAMSVLARFVELRAVIGVNPACDSGRRTTLGFESESRPGEGSITTSWSAPEMVRITRLELEDGTILSLRHLTQEAVLERSGQVTVVHRGAGLHPSWDRYEAMFDAYLADKTSVPDDAFTLALHALLESGEVMAA
jgi:predicted dehydrogenase